MVALRRLLVCVGGVAVAFTTTVGFPASAQDVAKVATENGFEYQEKYGVIVECADEAQQKRVFDELTAAGHRCRVVAV